MRLPWQTSRQETAGTQPRIQPGEALLVVVSPRNDLAWGYSQQTGDWSPIEFIAPVADAPQVFTGECVAMIQAGSYVYGFSAEAGRWDTQQLNGPVQSKPIVLKDLVAVQADGRIHAFSGKTARWSTLDVRAQVQRGRRR